MLLADRPSHRQLSQRSSTLDEDDAISTLNDLIETSKDGEHEFPHVRQRRQERPMKALFDETAKRCATGAAELQTKVRTLGGDPEKRGSTSALLHRG
jgi:uncharacterized protein (TIGR02284 family)